ncbi:class E sortase [Corynebacterium sp. A21]|uniref:class E sortase n=1 Tax=Corynebacterium sp. A21 TaxID=3457318 RepID=UPI003FD092F8
MSEQGQVNLPVRSTPGWRAAPGQILGEILMTIGVLALLFAFYEAYWTNISSGQKQAQAQESLAQSWGETEEGERANPRQRLHPELGEAFARMHIPAFGSDFQFAVIEGTDETDLLAGPGRYVDSQMPGQPGNFAVAGHRVGKGAPFNDLGNLKVCDAVVVETQTSWETYRVLPIGASGTQRLAQAQSCFSPEQATDITEGSYSWVEGRRITVPGDIGVLSPVPGQQTALNDDLAGLLTLTTCHPQFSNAERMIVHAMLVESTPKDPAGNDRPEVLEEN